MPNPPIQFRSEELEPLLRELDTSAGQAAKWLLEAYLLYVQPSVLASLKFTEPEAIALWQDLNGWRMSPDALQLMWANIADPMLQARIKSLSLCEVLAIAVAIRRVGAEQYTIAELPAELRRVGLCK